MELLTKIVVEYLKHNKRLVVPKLGAFIVKQGEGRIMFSELMRGDDGVLRSLLMAYGINEIEAAGMIDRLVFELRHAVSHGETFTIEGLGSFSAGENNTITFKQYREVRSVGGSVRPPFEQFNEAKRSLSRRQGTPQGGKSEQPKRAPQSKGTATKQRAAEDGLNLNKPESYLRGLKYENKKSKGRDDEYYGGDKRRSFDGRKMVVVLVATLILGVAGWLVWSYIFNSSSDNKPTSDVVIEARGDAMMASDTLPKCDSIPATGIAADGAGDAMVGGDVANKQ